MRVSDVQLLFDYNYWTNHLLLAKAAELSHEQLVQENTFPYKSLLGTLVHTLDAEYVWRTLLQHKRFSGRLVDKQTFATLDALVTAWQAEEAAMRAYINTLSDDDMDGILRYEVPEGLRERVIWQCLVHVVNHGTQHRSEAAQMLTDFGHSPGNIDLSLYVNTLGPA